MVKPPSRLARATSSLGSHISTPMNVPIASAMPPTLATEPGCILRPRGTSRKWSRPADAIKGGISAMQITREPRKLKNNVVDIIIVVFFLNQARTSTSSVEPTKQTVVIAEHRSSHLLPATEGL